jgi:hypothetical protein
VSRHIHPTAQIAAANIKPVMFMTGTLCPNPYRKSHATQRTKGRCDGERYPKDRMPGSSALSELICGVSPVLWERTA